MSTHAQLLKKLKQKAENALENAVLNKTESLIQQQTEKALDDVFTLPTNQKGMSAEDYMVNTSEVPESYEFDWKYKLNFKTAKAKDNMSMTFYLKEDADYWGAGFDQDKTKIIMVYDTDRKILPMFMEAKGEKFISVTKLLDIEPNSQDNDFDYDDYNITEIPGKTILSYQCKGYKMENDAYIFTLYITFDVSISFSDIYTKSKQVPQNFNLNWLKDKDNEGVLMEMIMVDKKKRKNNITATCVTLEKEAMKINKSAYEGG
ncbi:MAG: DUF4412 domain-containing protein [Psychroserpens sp.]|nr:DUF4412 domain-containing protein [Psychroserpens sp.]